MGKRRQPSLIYSEWESLVFGRCRSDESFPPEVEERWRTLWRDHMAADTFLNTNVDDAALLCSLGWDLAVQQRDWASGLSRLERWFEHPGAAGADLITILTFRSWLGLGRLWRGEVREALSLFHALVEEAPVKRRCTALYLVRSHLLGYCQEQAADAMSPPELTQLVLHVAAQLRIAKRTGCGGEATTATYGNLSAVLEALNPV